MAAKIELIRSTEGEKGKQIANVCAFGAVRNGLVSESLRQLPGAARERRNVFERLVEAVKTYLLGQMSYPLYELGGEYRRNM